jgi:hypothetical protein
MLLGVNRLRDGGAAPDDAAVQVQFLLLPLQNPFFDRTCSDESVYVNHTGLTNAVNTSNSLNVFLRIPAKD